MILGDGVFCENDYPASNDEREEKFKTHNHRHEPTGGKKQ